MRKAKGILVECHFIYQGSDKRHEATAKFALLLLTHWWTIRFFPYPQIVNYRQSFWWYFFWCEAVIWASDAKLLYGLLMRSCYMGFWWIVWNYPTETAGSTSRIKKQTPLRQADGGAFMVFCNKKTSFRQIVKKMTDWHNFNTELTKSIK